MALSLEQATRKLAELTKNGRIASQAELHALVSEVSVDAQGSITILYGGRVTGLEDVSASVQSLGVGNYNYRVIGKTAAADLLKHPSFIQAIADCFHVSVNEVRGVGDYRGSPANLFLEGTDGLWGDVSVRFIQDTKGEVRILTEAPDKTRAQRGQCRINAAKGVSIARRNGVSHDIRRGVQSEAHLAAICSTDPRAHGIARRQESFPEPRQRPTTPAGVPGEVERFAWRVFLGAPGDQGTCGKVRHG